MNTELESILKDQFLNKKISVFIQDRDNYGKLIPNKYVTCVGQCTFIGSNPYLNWDLQVTIDGMPVRVRHVNDLALVPERTRKKS